MAEKRTTIADISRKLNVSMHTVNKALYGKKGVGEELREKILLTAREMNYRANRVAQSMARNPMVIGIISHASAWPMIGKQFMTGLRNAIEQLQDYNVNGRYYSYTSEQERAAAIGQTIRDGVSVVICLHFVPSEKEAELLTSAKIPFALLGTDGMENRRLTSVRADSLMAGRLAAELLAMALPPNAPVVVFTGFKNYRDHADKVAGFTTEMAERGRQVNAIYEHSDLPEIAARQTDAAFADCPDLAGIYSATGNSVAICRRIMARHERPLIVATDIYDEIKELIHQGVIAATIYQNAAGQARKLVELLYASLCENQPVDGQVFIPPAIVLRANVDTF